MLIARRADTRARADTTWKMMAKLNGALVAVGGKPRRPWQAASSTGRQAERSDATEKAAIQLMYKVLLSPEMGGVGAPPAVRAAAPELEPIWTM